MSEVADSVFVAETDILAIPDDTATLHHVVLAVDLVIFIQEDFEATLTESVVVGFMTLFDYESAPQADELRHTSSFVHQS